MTAAYVEQELARQLAYWRHHLRVDDPSGHNWRRARRFPHDVAIGLGLVRFMQFALAGSRSHLSLVP